jgi:hypothetical protein
MTEPVALLNTWLTGRLVRGNKWRWPVAVQIHPDSRTFWGALSVFMALKRYKKDMEREWPNQ